MKKPEYLLHARALRADILGAPAIWLPRREALVDWLEQFLQRAATPEYELGETEAADLAALDKFLRRQSIPTA